MAELNVPFDDRWQRAGRGSFAVVSTPSGSDVSNTEETDKSAGQAGWDGQPAGWPQGQGTGWPQQSGWPQGAFPQGGPPTAPPAPNAEDPKGPWSPKVYIVLSGLFSFFPAAVLYELNWRRLKQPRSVTPRIALWTVGLLAMMAAAVVLPDKARHLFWGLNFGLGYGMAHWQGPQYETYVREGWPVAKLRHAAMPLIVSIVATVALGVALGFGYVLHIDKHFEDGVAAMNAAAQEGDAAYERSKKHFERYLEMEPEDTHAMHNLALVEANLGHYAAARSRIGDIAKLEPSYADLQTLTEIVNDTQHDAAIDKLREKDRVGAEQLLKALSEAQPDYARAPYSLGLIYAEDKRHQDARDQLKRLTELSPTEDWVSKLRDEVFFSEHDHAVELLNDGKLEEAEKLFVSSRELRPEDELAVFHLMLLYRRQDRLDRAIELGEEFLRKNLSEKISDHLETMKAAKALGAQGLAL